MIAAAFLVLLRPYSIQCVLLLLLLLLGTIATILFFCCWHRRLRNGKHPIKSVLSGRTKSRGEKTHRGLTVVRVSQGFRHSPRHARRSIHARVTEEKPNLVEIPESEPESSSSLRKRKVKKRVLPEFYQSVQVTPTRKPSSSSGNPSLHGSMSSSADFSDEDDYSVKSGSASPAPGDTLPWNLPRHERSKRKIQGGSVLDPAERAVLRIADERDRVQKKTFTKWINQHLVKVRKHINDLYEDLRDGHNLISLLEVLSGDTLPRERDFLKTLRLVSGTEACAVEQHGDTMDDDKGPRERGRMRFHRLQNVQIALDYLKRRQVKLVNIRNDDITDGNPKLTLGLIWTIILHFQISEIHVTGESEDMTAKERLLLWSKQITEGYVGVRCDNFTTSWRDGRLLNAIIHKYRPDMVDMSYVSTQTNRSNLEHAFSVAEQLGVARLLDPEDVDVQSPDEKSVITYVSTLYDAFPKVPDGVDGISPNDVDIKWVEYQNMIKYLSQWIKHNVAIMSDRSFPNNPVELKALYTQYLQFKEHEIPLKENEKTKIKNLYKMLEMWIEFGRIQLPQDHHPNDVEKEWGKLIIAMLEREKSLRPEVERLEMLQQIANRVQRDCVNGEDKLALARTALQSDAKRLESGIQFLNEAEIAGYLLECENILRQQVVDIQILLDGKFPFADQLVQRVSKLRDELLALRAECSSVYSKGRTLTTEQTKMMISGITQSLNSGFSQNINTSLTPALTPALTPGGLGTPGSTFTSSLTPCLTPSLTPALTPGLQPTSVQSYMGSGGGMDPGSLRQLKHMQIRKPLLKSSLADSNMTEEEVNMKFVQDLLNWVEEMQLQLDRSEWGSDLPSVEMHLENHKSVHRAIEDFQMSLKDAKLSEIQMNLPLKLTYSDKLNKLERQYERLLSCSRERQSHLESLHDFVSQATQELIWLNEKEEEEVAFDWSDRNSNISKKRDYHADLMRELDEKEEVIKSVQDKAERLMLKNHPARLTIEAYRAAMQTQWSWILQLCSCVEQHLKENAVYFEFFSDAKESMDYLKSLQDAIQRKYSCDRTSSLHRLEDLIQESMDEKEQLLQYRSTVAGLVGRAKNIVQLRPRNPESPVRSSIPVKAICDYRQIEITIYKDDECVLANNSHRAKWKVINPAGNEAMVPSVCFTVPPPNKEAVDMATRTEQLYQNVLALWHHSHVNMKSVVSWHYLMADIRAIRNWNVSSIKTMLQGDHQQVLSNLQSHFDEFLEDSEESEVFTVADCAQLERDVVACKEYYQELLRSAEREEHEESVYNHYISEIRNFRMHLEAHEEHLIRQLRTPLERDDLEQSLQRITEHEKKTAELNKLKEDLDVMKDKCELFLRQAAGAPSVQTLSSELTVLVQSMSQVNSMSSIYMDKLKTVSLVVKHSQSAEALVKTYESKLYEEDAMNSDVKSIESVISTLKQWRSEIDEKQEVFHDMEDELQKARVISDRMFKVHNERDFDLDWHKEKADQLSERWQNIHSQIDNRLRDLDGISKSLKHYRDSYSCLDEWVREMEVAQLKAQENKPEDSKALAELLNKQKVLVAEIEQTQSRIDECQKYSEQYSSSIKDYELQLMTFRAMVDSQHKSPLKKRRMQSSSDAIQQEFMDLRTRYTALVTLMTQYVKFASETLRRTEDEEVRDSYFNTSWLPIFPVANAAHFRLLQLCGCLNLNASLQIKIFKSQVEGTKSQVQIIEEELNKKTQTSHELQMKLQDYSEEVRKTTELQQKIKTLNSNIAATGSLTDLATGQTHSVAEALEKGIIEKGLKDKLIEAEKAFSGYIHAGKKLSVFQAMEERVLDRYKGKKLLEVQVSTGGLINPEIGPHVCLDWDDACKQDLTYKSTLNHLPELNESSKCIQSSHVSSVSLSDIAAAREGATCEDPIIKMIEVKEVSDGLQVYYTGDALTLERAFQCGLIPASVYIKILQRQKTCQDVSLLEPVQEVEPCEVNSMILKCLSGNKSLTLGRDVHTLRSFHDGLSDQETTSGLLSVQMDVDDPKEGQNITAEDVMSSTGSIQNGDGLKVDAAIQCDLMSSSSTLTILGNQQFMGIVLPSSGEIQTVSTSFQYEQQITTNEFTSRLFSNREKIAAFYVPESSEVVDITSAIQNGLIDSYTAEILKSIEIPDVFPDVDHLNEKFSSWLMYKKLTVDGRYHAADCLKVDNIPTHTEAKQLFISYLMINSYIDPRSGQRVLILDKQLNKMVKIFLEDSILSENTEKNVTSLTLTVGDVSEQEDLEIPLYINEETEELMRYTQHTSDPHNFVSSVNGRISLDKKTDANDKALKQDPVNEVLVDSNINMNTTELSVAEETMCQNYTDWTKSGEFTERISGNSLQIDVGVADSEDIDIPVLSVVPTSCSVNRLNGVSPSTTFDTECAVKSRHQTLPYYDPDSLCSESEGTDITQADFLCSEDLMEDENEQDYAIHLLKAQMEEGGILDVTSGRRYDLEAALRKGLVDEMTVLKLLCLQSDEQGGIGIGVGDEECARSVLKQAVSDGSISSNIALSIIEQQSPLRSGCTISISDSLQSGLVEDEDVNKILNLDPKDSIYPEESCTHSIPEDHNQGLININEAEIMQQPTERKVAVIVLDLIDEEADNKKIEHENVDAEVDCETTGNVEKMSNYLHHSPPSVGGHESLVISPSSWSKVTAECVHHTDRPLLLAEDSDSQDEVNSELTDEADVYSVVIENADPCPQSRPSSLSDGTSSISTDPEIQTQYATSAAHTEFFIAGYDAKVGNQTVNEMSSSHRNVLFEESRMENDTSAAQSPFDSEPTPSRDYSSPRDSVESAIISVSRGNGNYNNNITEDGSRVPLPQPAALHSESDFNVEPEPRYSHNDQSLLVDFQYLQELLKHSYFHLFFQDTENNLLKEARLKLEDITFDIQCFISEHTQFLSPAQSSYLLKFLSTTQRAFRDQTERLSLLAKHKEFTEKLEEVCDNLTLTENHLIGHQQQAENAECVTDLQQYQQEHQALQKDVLTNASALNEVITSTKKFLEENRSKLLPDQIAMLESKLEEAKSKAKLIDQRAEESRKDLEKVVTTAIKQESEKVRAAAVERLEESKNKIEGLLDWISNIGNENQSGLDQTDHISKENGNVPEKTFDRGLIKEDDDANGNALQTTEKDSGRESSGKNDASLDLDKQYDRVKAHHQEILSQQQDLILATQSAQALLDKKANMLSPEEKEKLQKNIQELKGRYEASLTQAEQQMKQVQCVQEELKKFQNDCEEFEGWLDQAEGEIEELGCPAGSLNILGDKLQRQKSFSEDVISHKGDLRFITISGQKVLDVAKACGLDDPAAKNAPLHVDTSGTCLAVKDKLDSAASRYKTLHSQCNQLGNNLKDVVDKYKKYDDSSAGLLEWLNGSEEEARKQQSEAIAADPQTLQKQLEETKALQGQMTGHQTAIDTLRKTAESLITSEGDLLSNSDEIQETVDDIVERYDNLSKSVSDRNEKLQITLTRSMSVQDGLDEMMGWMEGVEASVKEKGQIPLDSASIGDILSKEALEQDIASRQSSISAMKAKVKKFVETADPSAAALLQSKMDTLSQRFSDACDKHKQKVSQLEQLKEKVEEFETVADKVQQFVVKRSQDLHETDGPGKTFNELSQLMQDTKAEMAEHASDLETLQTLSKELSEISPDGNTAQIQSKIDNLSNIFSTFKDTVKEKEEEVSSCQDQLGEFRSAASALTKWLEQTNEKVPAVQQSSSEKSLEKDLQIVTNYLMFSELMVIQQNMSFVNEGYASLGEMLKSRAAELNSSVQEVKEAQKETDNMMKWLKDMKKTAASWNNAATEKDSVKTQIEQQKAFEDDMKQKQEQLQKLRDKLLNLIKTHPNSPEAEKWKQMLAEIDAAWADVSGSVEERKQHLEQSNKNLNIFQTTELQLGQWLSEKELMMSVLGPLSIDPNMLKMQKQQVQILQNEFKSRKPQYEQLEEAASAILSSSGNQDPSSGKLVREQLAAVTQKWQGLTEKLDQRDSLIDQAVVKTGQFQELLRSLSQTASQLETELTNHQGQSTQPNAVKKQLEEVHNISGQLREERKKLKEAEVINAELIAMVTEDYLKADLARQLETVSKPFKQLEEKQLNSTFASSQQFHQTSKDFQSWLGEKIQDQSKPQPISAKVETLQQALEEHSKLQKALSEHEEAYNTITGEGEMLLQNTDGAEKLALQGQLSTLSSNWEEVKKNSVEQADKLQTALQRSLKYQEHAEKLSSWVQECEASEGRVKLTVDPVDVESSISQVKALQKDVDKHRGMVEQLNASADSLLEVANLDTESVKEEKASIGKRVDNVVEGLQSKRESLEKISHTVKEFNDAYKEAKAQLEGAQKQVDAYESQGAQAHSNKNLTNMKAQHKSLEGVQNQVEHLKSLAKDLVVDVPDADGVTDLLLQADSVEKDYSTLNKKLEDTCQVLEGKLQGIGQFQNSIREMFTCFTDLDDELDSMAPVDLDLATLKEQRESIQSFVSKLQELMANTANAGDSCKKMLETETSPDLLGLKRDLDALSKQCGKLLDRAKGREVQVQSTLTKLEELYGKLHQAQDKLCSAVDKEASQEAVGMETDIINQQLEAFKAFQKDDIDPLQTQLQDINFLGQGLIQTAAKGTSTRKLEDDLEEVNTKWNTLNKKRYWQSQLHEALLHCGRFQDALESLLSWLTDTEELMANQKPPSAEFKVVKAQIQEQKLLQRLLDDRKPTVELIKKEGGKVAELAESVDKEKVAKEIECLGQRWDALLKKAENRSQLESILVVTQQFYETLEPLSEWLAATEKQVANSEPIGTETSKLEDQISQHKALEEEIMNHSKDLFQAVSLGQMLKTVSSVDDKEFVQSRLDTTQASYIELQERCRRKAEMLQQALANAQLFGEDEVALMNWLNEVYTRLSEVSVEDYNIDVLEKQLAEQRALQSDIELRKQNVDQAICNGMELLKQTTGDEVIVIQGKLDGIKTKYAEINSMSDNVLKKLERVLSLSTKLQHTHDDLGSWLEKAEAESSAFADQEPVGEQLIHAQSRQKALLKETKDQKPTIDKLNELSSSLLDLIPWHTREGLDKLVTEDNERYRAVCDTITQQVDQINAEILKSQQFEQAADTELSWLTEAERKLLSMAEIRLEQDQTTAQLQAQKIFSMDIMRHKDTVDDIVKTGKAIMNSKNPEEKETLKVKIIYLRLQNYGIVSQLNSERCLQLERAQSLASQFWETYEEMWPWLQETLSNFSHLPPPAIEYETLRQQQEELRQMRELIAEHKPHIDKMNKTGPQLLELSPVEGEPIREKYTATDQLYTQLKADVKQRAATLDEAISKSTQFHDKIDPMLESLERIAERLRQPPSISVEVDKIKEQITENKAVSMDLEKLQPSYETLKQRGEEMIARSEGADKDISAKAVQDKLDHMVFLWSDIQALLEEREAKLLDVMDLADKFWCDHCALIVTIKDSQDLLRELEEPGVDPSVVKQQQEFVEGFKEEIDGLQEELDVVQNQGAELMTACGEPDKPVIKKSIDEVNSAWENLNKTWKERVERLEEAMQNAVQFQDGLQGMFDWVDILESKLDLMSPVGTDLETVKQQIVELKEFKGEAYQLQIEMERLNHQAGLLLKKVTEEADRCAIQEPMSELKMLWDNLDEKIISRQHKLEGGLLALGQFQHALDELLAWMSHTEELLNEQRKAGGDPKAIEIELAKHHVLQNDVLAHKATVETVNKAGNDLVESSAGEEASSLQSKLENLNQRWKAILEKTTQRKQQLESALLQAQGFHGEIEDMQQWLKDTERQLLASKAVGGLPDTAREQLNAHLELCSALEAKEELYQELMNKGHQLLAVTPEGPDSNTEQDLANLKDKWEAVQGKVAERKVKLEEALTLATDFHNSLQDFINWLTQAEQTLNMVSPASLILETIMFQIDEHKMFVTEVNSHREHIIDLDKTGTHLKYFSQKQDVVLIKNLLLSVQGRWEKLVQRSVERGRLLDDARKRAKQFNETWNKLMEWLDESEKTLDSEVEIANDPDKIKTQLAQHKEFQKALGSKHSVYDTTTRTGRALKDKTSLQDDNQKLDDMLSELRDKWDTVCGKSVERQNKLEEALLFSGQFTDALQALIDWLYRVEPQLAEDQPVHGDIDLVLNLIDNHKVFQKELGKRTVSVQALKRSAKELVESSHDDSSWVKVQMQELSTRWETVCNLSVSKQARLEQALCQAEEFHSTVHILLEWLAEAEQTLRFHGSLPDDEEALQALIEQHKEFMKKLEEKRVALNKATSMGEAILTICHPDSITTIKHWNTIIKARFEEVQAWARQHQQRLATALTELLTTQELLENLLTWLQWAETNLNDKDKEPLPQEIEEVKSLIAEHQAFMEEMTRKQPDVDKITKTHKRKAALEPPNQSQIPVLGKGRPGRKRSPTQTMYGSATQAPIETKNPRVNLLVTKWQHVWLLALDRRRKLNDAMDRLEELKEFANFDFDVWRKRYMRWMNHKKSRVMDFFRRIDKDQDGKVTRQEFIEGILSSKFPTSRLEMSAVADIFDRDGDGYIDYYEFVAALHPNKDAYKPLTDADKIEDEVTRQVAKCKCPKRFQVEQIGANKYRFGDSQQLRLVRILRSTVMVRVGGGWMALDEFLVKNDPCRVHHHGSKMLRSESNSSITQSPIAKGRTNMELREKFILPEGTTQVMASFRYRGRRSRPSSRGASPNRSTSSQSCPTPQHITRNYDKPWLTNSKPSTPLKSSDSFGSQGSSSEGTPVQGSKLRLPGYLSGKGFQSGEEGTLISAAVLKARTQTIDSRKNSSRPGSKAGSRGSSRRGSDASDFDISDIQSVCSDVSETVGDSTRATPRSASRQHGGKPSKIPTPQRRTTPTSKLAKGSKR
uniref:Dystonin n=1 Tax=Dicentrarchus labrax TaxID=13489 RepID=A0A8C4NWW1_DICLA